MAFEEFDMSNFWDDDEYSYENYISAEFTMETLKSIEVELGYKLPESYVEFMRLHNGGMPLKNCFPTAIGTSWSDDHIAITGIMGIGRDKLYSLCGEIGSRFMISEWGYPDTGIYICNCPSGGHDMVLLDYSHCGSDGEPIVVHVDQEFNYRKTFLADSFFTFITYLVSEEEL